MANGGMYAKSEGRWMWVYPAFKAATNIPIIEGGIEDTVMYNGVLHKRHTFNASGTAVVKKQGSFVLFMVGGGGPGGRANASGYECGGGGAGRVRWTSINRDLGSFVVTVGAGAAAGSNGGASWFDNVQSQGGRRGADGAAAAISGVGSNGGGAHSMTAGGVTTTPTDATTYATNGGTPTAASRGAGGGGAMQAGQSSGPGGAGIEFPPGSGVYYAGGGAGCVPGTTVAGGNGGGGRSINGTAAGEAGTANKGGGGGAGTNVSNAVGGKGGDGVVVLLYPADPQILLSSDKAPGQVTLTWTSIPSAVEYQLEQDGALSWHAASPVVVTGLTDGVAHTWRVRAFLPSGKFSSWSNPVTESSGAPFNAATGGTETTVTNYNGTGETWKVHTFTANGTFTVTEANVPFNALAVGGGGGGCWGQGTHASHPGGGGNGQEWTPTLTAQAYPIVIGGSGAGGSNAGAGGNGGASTFAGYTAAGGAGAPLSGPGATGLNAASTIRGSSEQFGKNGVYDPVYGKIGVYGCGAGGNYDYTGWGDGGGPGAVIIAYRIA